MEFIFVFVLVGAIWFFQVGSVTGAVEKALAGEGITVKTCKLNWWRGSRQQAHVDWTGTARATGEDVSGYADVVYWFNKVDLHFIRDFDRTRGLRERLARAHEKEEDELNTDGMGLEQRITIETNQRLERLMGDRQAFMENDTDGNGMVDSEEWDAARARVAAEVRAELSGVVDEPAEQVAVQQEVEEQEVEDQAW